MKTHHSFQSQPCPISPDLNAHLERHEAETARQQVICDVVEELTDQYLSSSERLLNLLLGEEGESAEFSSRRLKTCEYLVAVAQGEPHNRTLRNLLHELARCAAEENAEALAGKRIAAWRSS